MRYINRVHHRASALQRAIVLFAIFCQDIWTVANSTPENLKECKSLLVYIKDSIGHSTPSALNDIENRCQMANRVLSSLPAPGCSVYVEYYNTGESCYHGKRSPSDQGNQLCYYEPQSNSTQSPIQFCTPLNEADYKSIRDANIFQLGLTSDAFANLSHYLKNSGSTTLVIHEKNQVLNIGAVGATEDRGIPVWTKGLQVDVPPLMPPLAANGDLEQTKEQIEKISSQILNTVHSRGIPATPPTYCKNFSIKIDGFEEGVTTATLASSYLKKALNTQTNLVPLCERNFYGEVILSTENPWTSRVEDKLRWEDDSKSIKNSGLNYLGFSIPMMIAGAGTLALGSWFLNLDGECVRPLGYACAGQYHLKSIGWPLVTTGIVSFVIGSGLMVGKYSVYKKRR